MDAGSTVEPGFVVWLTGLSGSGKSTLARALRKELVSRGHLVKVLDGDDVRRGLCADLGYSAAERRENVRRVAEVARLLVESGFVVVAALISPLESDRRMARGLFAPDEFIETFCSAPLSVCEERDPKGLYRRARAAELTEFTGVSAPYEPPRHPEIVVDTARVSVEDSLSTVLVCLGERGVIDAPST